MKKEQEYLSSLLKTTQLVQAGIRSVLDMPMVPGLRHTLKKQLREFEAIETEAFSIASQRGWEIRELDPALRFLTDRIIRIRLTGRDTDSLIADLMILGNTKGLIRSIRNRNRYSGPDRKIHILSQRLLDCENAGIRQLQMFL